MFFVRSPPHTHTHTQTHTPLWGIDKKTPVHILNSGCGIEEVQLTDVGRIQTGGVPIRTKSASLPTLSCQLHQRGFTASFLFLEGKALVMARQSKQCSTGGGISVWSSPASTLTPFPFMQILKVHEKENKLNWNSRWNREGVDFAFRWWLVDETGTNSVTPKPSHKIYTNEVFMWHWPQVKSFQRFLITQLERCLWWNKCDYQADQSRARISLHLLFDLMVVCHFYHSFVKGTVWHLGNKLYFW